MGTALLICSSMSYAQILPEVDNGASSFVDGPPRSVSIVPAIDWIFLTAHLFLGDTP